VVQAGPIGGEGVTYRDGQGGSEGREFADPLVCVECLFVRSPCQAPYGANSACAKRAAKRPTRTPPP
jgi:hypothetical protein